MGIGKGAMKTTELLSRFDGGASPPVRAAYLTIKRLRKSGVANAQWEGIFALATENPDAYRVGLTEIAEWRLAELIAPHGLTGTPLTPSHLRQAKPSSEYADSDFPRVRHERRFWAFADTPGESTDRPIAPGLSLLVTARRYRQVDARG
jgi:hypothetical protein